VRRTASLNFDALCHDSENSNLPTIGPSARTEIRDEVCHYAKEECNQADKASPAAPWQAKRWLDNEGQGYRKDRKQDEQGTDQLQGAPPARSLHMQVEAQDRVYQGRGQQINVPGDVHHSQFPRQLVHGGMMVPQDLSGQQKRDNCNDSNDEMDAAQHERGDTNMKSAN